MPQCHATSKRTHERCQRPARIGRTVCHQHGGAAGRPPTHGRYSKSLPKDLVERYEYFKTDPNILDLQPEIAQARAMYERFCATMVEGQGISAEFGGELREWLDHISRIVERCHKIQYGERYVLTVHGVTALMAAAADKVKRVLGSAVREGLLTESYADRLAEDIGRAMCEAAEGR